MFSSGIDPLRSGEARLRGDARPRIPCAQARHAYAEPAGGGRRAWDRRPRSRTARPV